MAASSVSGHSVRSPSLEQVASCLDLVPDPVFLMRPVHSADGRVVDLVYVHVNRAAADLYQRPVEDIVGRSQLELFPSVREIGLFDRYVDALEQQEPGTYELPVFDENGVAGAFALAYFPVPEGLFIVATDITGQRMAEAALADRVEQLRAVLDSSLDCVSRYGPDLRFEYVNHRVEVVSGIPASRWIGASHRELGFSAEQADLWEGHIRAVFESGQTDSFTYEVDNVLGHQWWEADLSPEFDPIGQVTHVVSTNHDVTPLVVAENRLRELATRDPLTGLANRAGMAEEIERTLLSAQRTGRLCAVLMLDLDRFKLVNDSHGHCAGDQLLRAAGERMLSRVRGGDLVARPGGDEFVVVMRDIDSPDEAIEAAQRLVDSFRQPFSVEGSDVYATASVGVMLAQPGHTSDDLLRGADSAMYEAKAGGRDRVAVFDERQRRDARRRLELEGALRHAADHGDLEAWYQPEVDLATGRLVAVEALLRWHHPSGRVVPAGHFIDVVEETGLIVPVGAQVLRQACEQARAWSRELGDGLLVRVNFSALQLQRPTLLEEVDAILRETGADPTRICAEITETVWLRDLDPIRRNIEELRARGFELAIDDFGTGYASLTYLRRYPITVLKIDRSFVTSLGANERDEHLVAGLISLAKEVGVQVTAEGVDTYAQVSKLRHLGCPTAQGFLFSQAVPAEEIPRLARTPFDIR